MQAVYLEVSPGSRSVGVGGVGSESCRVREPGHGYGKQELNSAGVSLEASRMPPLIVPGDKDIHSQGGGRPPRDNLSDLGCVRQWHERSSRGRKQKSCTAGAGGRLTSVRGVGDRGSKDTD